MVENKNNKFRNGYFLNNDVYKKINFNSKKKRRMKKKLVDILKGIEIGTVVGLTALGLSFKYLENHFYYEKYLNDINYNHKIDYINYAKNKNFSEILEIIKLRIFEVPGEGSRGYNRWYEMVLKDKNNNYYYMKISDNDYNYNRYQKMGFTKLKKGDLIKVEGVVISERVPNRMPFSDYFWKKKYGNVNKIKPIYYASAYLVNKK